VPEGLEIEIYRRHAEQVVGRTITAVVADDDRYVRGVSPSLFDDALVGRRIVATSAHGKLLMLHTDGRHTLGLRFGMTGRLVVDGSPGIDTLEYSSARLAPQWDRFALHFDHAATRTLSMNDPRRFGSAEIDPSLDGLGPDALTLTLRAVRAALATSASPLKARLMDQRVIAGIGNLLADEVLWRARLSPHQPANAVGSFDVARLHRVIRRTLPQLLARGGSHMGDLMACRSPGAHCPRCAEPLRRDTIGGRTFWCPAEQR
jgi:formamidopyrimidine-DNA glycosylase